MKNWNIRFGKLVNRLGRLLVVLCSTATLISLIVTSSPEAFGVTPAPDGAYPVRNTAEGQDSLFSWTSTTEDGENTALGYEALYNDTNGGDYNTGVGSFVLFNDTTGGANTGVGANALEANQTGNENTATGFQALLDNTIGNYNTAHGAFALQSNTSGTNNTAIGGGALESNQTGSDNTATGYSALLFNTASNNTANGFQALSANTSGAENTATGSQALLANISGGDNTATGIGSLSKNTNGSSNTATGAYALFSNTAGAFNTASGENALRNDTGSSNTAMGIQALNNNTSGSNNTAIGALAGQNLTTGNNNIDIGANVLGNTGDANTIRIGKSGTQQKTFIAGIYGKTVASGVGVIINSNGQLGTVQSSLRFKDNIKPMAKASEAILKLKPVTFRYKEELDSNKIPQFGLIAEEVEKVDPDLVVRDQDGTLTTVRYEAVNAMLLNEFLKEHRKVQTLEGMIGQQQQQIKTLTATVQEVNDRLELVKNASQQRCKPEKH